MFIIIVLRLMEHLLLTWHSRTSFTVTSKP